MSRAGPVLREPKIPEHEVEDEQVVRPPHRDSKLVRRARVNRLENPAEVDGHPTRELARPTGGL